MKVAVPSGSTPEQFGQDLKDSLNMLVAPASPGAGAGTLEDLKDIGRLVLKKGYFLKSWFPSGIPEGARAGSLVGDLAANEEMFRKYQESQNPLRSTDIDREFMSMMSWGQSAGPT
jgi:hypothetical protein